MRKVVVSVGGSKSKYLGYFLTPELAHANSQETKYQVMCTTLEKYKKEDCFRQDVYDSIFSRAEKILEDRNSGRITYKL